MSEWGSSMIVTLTETADLLLTHLIIPLIRNKSSNLLIFSDERGNKHKSNRNNNKRPFESSWLQNCRYNTGTVPSDSGLSWPHFHRTLAAPIQPPVTIKQLKQSCSHCHRLLGVCWGPLTLKVCFQPWGCWPMYNKTAQPITGQYPACHFSPSNG